MLDQTTSVACRYAQFGSVIPSAKKQLRKFRDIKVQNCCTAAQTQHRKMWSGHHYYLLSFDGKKRNVCPNNVIDWNVEVQFGCIAPSSPCLTVSLSIRLRALLFYSRGQICYYGKQNAIL